MTDFYVQGYKQLIYYMRTVVFSFILILLVSFRTTAQQSIIQDSDERLYLEALKAFQMKSFASSKTLFDRYIELSASDQKPEALYYLAYSRLKTGHPSAVSELHRFIEKSPGHPLAKSGYFVIGNHYFDQKDFSGALTYYNKTSPGNLEGRDQEEWYFKRGYCFAMTGEHANAIRDLQSALEFRGDWFEQASYYLGEFFYKVRDFYSALNQLQPIDDGEGPFEEEIPQIVSAIYFEQGNYQQLYEYAGSRVSESVSIKNKTLNRLMGEGYYIEKKYRQATRYLQRFLDLSGNKANASLYYKLAISYFQTGEDKKAVDYFKLAGLEKGDMGQAASFYLGQLYLRQNNQDYALSAFKNVIKGGSNAEMSEEALFLTGKINYDRKQFAEAVTDLTTYLSIYQGSRWRAEANELLAQAYLNTSNYDQAIAHLEQIRNKSPLLKKAYQKVTFQKGQLLFNDNRFNDAIASLEKAVQFPVETDLAAQSFYLLGDSYSLVGKDQRALESYVSSKKYGKSRWTVNADYGLAYVYYNRKEYAPAERYFNDFLRKTETTSDFYNDARVRLADCMYVQKKYEAAIRLYEEIAATTAFQRDYVYYQLGLAYNLKGNASGSRTNFKKVLSDENSSFADNALFQLAQTYVEEANFTQAVPLLSQLIQSYPNSPLVPYARGKRALSYFNMGRLSESKADYLYTLEHHISHPAANAALLGLQEIKNRGEAVPDFEKHLEVYRKANPDDSSLEVIAFETAKTMYYNQLYRESITALRGFIEKYPTSGFLEDAYYFLADAAFRTREWTVAVAFFGKLFEFENSAYATRALDKRGKALIQLKAYDQAVSNYRSLQKVSSSPKDHYLALDGLMNAYFALGRADSTLYFSKEILSSEWKPANAESAAWLIRGKIYLQQKNYNAAQDEFIKAINEAANESGAEAKYLLAEVFFQQKQYSRSLETLFDLNRNYASYQYWIGRSFLLIADNYFAMNELLQAEATLNSIVENAKNEEIIAMAKQKLEKVRAKREEVVVRDTIKSDTIK